MEINLSTEPDWVLIFNYPKPSALQRYWREDFKMIGVVLGECNQLQICVNYSSQGHDAHIVIFLSVLKSGRAMLPFIELDPVQHGKGQKCSEPQLAQANKLNPSSYFCHEKKSYQK